MERFTLLKLGNIIHIRTHKLLSEDKTCYYHNHPFSYCSVIISGGYVEEVLSDIGSVVTKTHSVGSIILRHKSVYHKITSVMPFTKTLFCAVGNSGHWHLKAGDNNTTTRPEDGLYQRIINNKNVWSLVIDGMYYIGNQSKEIASKERRLSIYQDDTNILTWQ